MDTGQQKTRLKWREIVILVVLKDKDVSEKDIHIANTL